MHPNIETLKRIAPQLCTLTLVVRKNDPFTLEVGGEGPPYICCQREWPLYISEGPVYAGNWWRMPLSNLWPVTGLKPGLENSKIQLCKNSLVDHFAHKVIR